ncbi:MAG: TM2 domain-containing protein [Bacteroidales bacterium]|nr:TM2 domain-containing protein [Bacteroidales bacterium]
MKKLLLTLVAVFALCFAASAANYSINDDLIDQSIENAVDITSSSLQALDMAAAAASSSTSVSSGKSDGLAVALTFILGGFGVHRHYMGTSRGMWAAYTFTFGGIFGVVPLIDFIVEIVGLVDGTGLGKYYNNPKFFMWS